MWNMFKYGILLSTPTPLLSGHGGGGVLKFSPNPWELSQMGGLNFSHFWAGDSVLSTGGIGGICPSLAKNVFFPSPPQSVPPVDSPTQFLFHPTKGSSPN